MRSCLFTLLTILTLIYIPQEIGASEDDKQSIIIEVEGDPKEHQAYVELYHPFVDVVATYDTLFNGLALRGDPEKLAKLASLEFVKTIHPTQMYQAISTPSDRSPSQIWNDNNAIIPADLNTTNFTGKGVKVAVIDTGIDYNHPDLAINYQGGYDLVDLDDDPMETVGTEGMPTVHGTHVAGIIAANGGLQGVAKDAEIYAYRALGPGGSGSSVQVIAAMEQAVKDGVDVMNLSLGNTVNGPDYPTSIAVNQAVDLGVAVVIANGNDGPENWTVGSPATASKALAVGASALPQKVAYLYESLKDKSMPITSMVGAAPWTLKKDYEIVNRSEQLRGKIALLKRSSETPFYELAKQAQDDGATAVVIYNNEEGNFQGSVEDSENPITIPVAGISEEDGKWLLQQIDKDSLYLQTSYMETKIETAPFSSRGPVTVNWNIKPDVLAPGTNILSTIPEGYQQLQGTSMAAPHVTGAIALLKEAQPDWTNKQIIGALKTSAQRIKTVAGSPVDPIIQGMGQIQIQEAMDAETIIDQPLLSFGKMTANLETKKIELMIENTTNKTQKYTFTIPKKQTGLSWKLPQSFTLEKQEKKRVPVELSVSTPLLKEGIHQGWLTLNKADETYDLPYLFVNKTADYQKAMGLEFMLKPFSDDTYEYHFYTTDELQSFSVNLYDPDTLLFERELLQLTEELQIGVNQGRLKKSQIGEMGHYTALITVQLKNGEFESYEKELFIE